jgi:outer membrane protein W
MWFYNLKLNWNILGHTAMAKIPFESHVKHAHTHTNKIHQNPMTISLKYHDFPLKSPIKMQDNII